MASLRMTFLGVIAALAAAALAGPASPAKNPAASVPQIVFPLVGDVQVDDNWGDPRPNGRHAGIDLMTPRRTPVVAAEAGKVKWWTTSARAGCMLYLYGVSGTTYLYIHLNNDQTLKNDNKGGCVAASTYTVADGGQVTAGQLIAWSGDSGDADGNPHLHFEVHPNDGVDIDPYNALVTGERLLFPGRIGSKFTVGLRGTPTTVGAGTLTMAVSAVRWWPGGRWSPIASRVVRLRLATNAKVDESLATQAASLGEQAVDRSVNPEQLTAFTSPQKVTASALRGEPESLVAARVSRPGGALVSLTPPDTSPTDTTDTTTTDDPESAFPPRPF